MAKDKIQYIESRSYRKFNEEYLKHTNQVELKIKTAMLKEILKDLSSQYSEGN